MKKKQQQRRRNPLEACVRANLNDYFVDLHGIEPADMHPMLVRAVEKPLLEVVMERCDQNQSRAAQWLGLNRNTLRKKLAQHGMLQQPAPTGK